MGTVLSDFCPDARSPGHCRCGEADRVAEVRAAIGRTYKPIGQLFAVWRQHQRQSQDWAALVGLLEQVFLVATVQPWFTNTLKRIVKTPKLHFLDSGLLASVRGLTFDRVKADRGTFGALLESFVFSEVLKLMTASDLRLTPYHFRDRDMREVDIVLERDDGMIAGIEVKASATVKAGDFGGLRALAEACGDRFAFGVVLYDNTDVVPFGDKLAAVPLSSMWG
nr:DUF4143 domain-containing protein [Rhizobium leguminosarum]